MIADEGVLDYREGSAIKVSVRQNETIAPVRLDKDHPLLSTISSVVPSPDWFSGFYSFNMIDPATDSWYDKVVFETYPWDAGVDSGSTYESQNAPIIPSYIVTQLTVGTVPDSGAFLSPDGNTVFPVSRWTCTRVEQVPLPKLRTTSGVFVSSFFVTVLMLLGATASLL